MKKDRKGEIRKANNGQLMKIIEYRNCNDIDIEFEDKSIVKHKAYKQFKKGEIKNPKVAINTYTKQNRNVKKYRKGEISYAKDGMKMMIDNYENAHNVNVKFEDGLIVLHKNYCNFKNGDIKHPKIFPNGIEIIEFAYRIKDEWYYRCRNDDWTEEKILPISEIAPEPVMTSKNITERRVIYGSVKNQTMKASNGMMMKCIEDNGSKDITVQFEDKAIAYHQRRESFLKGHIRHPNEKPHSVKNAKEKHVGEVYYDKNGRKMTIVEFNSNSNVTIEYEDKTRLYNKEYRIIKKGADLYPKTRVGETKIARNGLKMTIIDDRVWNDVHIQFEDGEIVTGVTKQQFDSGAIKHPKYNGKSHKQAQERQGLKAIMKNGLEVEIIEYRNASDMDVKFENGLISLNRDWNSFRHKRMGMPHYVGNLFIKEFAYRLGEDWFYIVKSDDFDEDKIMSVKEMYAYTHVNHADIRPK